MIITSERQKNNSIQSTHYNFPGIFFNPLSLSRIYKCFFLAFYTFQFRVWILGILTRTLFADFTSHDYLVVIEASKLAESALFLSWRELSFSYFCLKFLKNYRISVSIRLQLSILPQQSMENLSKKYFTLIYLLSPRHSGSKLKVIPFVTKQCTKLIIYSLSSSKISSPRSRIHLSKVNGAYSQQKQQSSSTPQSTWWKFMRNQCFIFWRNSAILVMINCYFSEQQTNFFCTNTYSSSPIASVNSPNGYFSYIFTMRCFSYFSFQFYIFYSRVEQ